MIKEVEPLTAGALLTVPGHSTAEEAINAGAGQELNPISALKKYLEFILIVQEIRHLSWQRGLYTGCDI